TQQEMDGVPHHMLGVVPVNDKKYSVAAYRKEADSCIADITKRGKLPLIVGGTGLYINALTYPLRFTEIPGDEAVRAALQAEEEQAPGVLYEKLSQVDSITASRLHPNDKKRIIRAMEVYTVSGKPLSAFGTDFSNDAGEATPYNAIQIGLTMPRELLYERIEQRVDTMLTLGLYEEVKSLFEKGYDRSLPALQGLGYKQLLNHFYGDCTLEEAIAAIKLETRHFAKRQMTWFKRDSRIQWLDVTAYASAEALAQEIVKLIKQGRGNHAIG
ncbi:MAG: tRNA (adenosine(37)-N6)-dimethylallyltransferase MiaA, partial [Eubacteriales bacterium]|nr:tRNA (adenosine(37)-N6)-dimethylallyltransferase MiaA [Eubacteriales bacterium]